MGGGHATLWGIRLGGWKLPPLVGGWPGFGPGTLSGGALWKTPPYFVLVRFEGGAYGSIDVKIRAFQSGKRGAAGWLGCGDGALSRRISRSVSLRPMSGSGESGLKRVCLVVG